MTIKAQMQSAIKPGEKEVRALHILETKRSVEEAARLLPEAAKRHGFGVLGTHDLKAKLKEKGLPFDNDCLVFEVCSPRQAQTVMTEDMSISTALPCRISVYRDANTTKIATIKPTALLDIFQNPKLRAIAEKVERDIFAIMDELR